MQGKFPSFNLGVVRIERTVSLSNKGTINYLSCSMYLQTTPLGTKNLHTYLHGFTYKILERI